MGNMWKQLAWIAAGLMALLIGGCSQQSGSGDSGTAASAGPAKQAGTEAKAAGEKIKIGFIVKQPEEPWFQQEWKFADQAAEKYGFELMKISAPDGEKVLTAIDTLAAAGAKGFVICTPDPKLGPAITNKAKAAGMKLLAVDDQFVGPDGKFMTEVPYLGISARQIGEAVGKTLFEEMKKRGWKQEEVAVCQVTWEELNTTKERTDGARDALIAAGFPKEKIYKAPQKTTDIPGSLDAVSVLLTQHPEVKKWLVCGNNDSAVMGAVRAMENRQLGPESVIAIGINGTDCILEFKKEKATAFFGSMLLAPKRHGFDTAEMVYKWVKDGIEPPKDTRTVGIFINRENYAKVRAEQGLGEEEKK